MAWYLMNSYGANVDCNFTGANIRVKTYIRIACLLHFLKEHFNKTNILQLTKNWFFTDRIITLYLYEYDRPTMLQSLQNMKIVTQLRRGGIFLYQNIFYCCCAFTVFNFVRYSFFIANNIFPKPRNTLYFLGTLVSRGRY